MITVETMKETAAAAEPPELPPHWFLYLVERMDRMENNLRSEFRQEIGDVRRELHGIYRWSIGLLVTMLLGFGGIVVTLAVTLR
ncbi:hypothetical protein [Desulfofundulus sp. TPOSR]|uniref:hypothetical protein n=1 Tax=Desulfofundulus sp. TPOSR TaxID=2714340 RepID=UPI0028BF3F99|nr:hypothetical protein [Desulfofundulus sp. TPOSR]